jgi:tetratricopeptide (TPR) repeat protein
MSRTRRWLAGLAAPLAVFIALTLLLKESEPGSAAPEPQSTAGLNSRGAQLLERVRQGGPLHLYDRAEAAFERALAIDPRDQEAAVGLASVAMGRHDFGSGLQLAREAHALEPSSVQALPVLVDARIELGRYAAAAKTLERLVSLKPGVAAYARISYLRELQGDVAGAVQAMRLARDAAAANPPAIAFTSALLGELALDQGRYELAEREFRTALAAQPGFGPTEEGRAHLLAARGDYRRSIEQYRALTRAGGADVAASLAAIEAATGRERAARRHYAIAKRRFAAELEAGLKADAGAVQFAADIGAERQALALGRDTWRRAPSVTSADAYASALSAAGRERASLRLSRRALATGWRDPEMLFRAGIVAKRAGAVQRAERLLRSALEASPRFHGVDAPVARSIVARLSG